MAPFSELVFQASRLLVLSSVSCQLFLGRWNCVTLRFVLVYLWFFFSFASYACVWGGRSCPPMSHFGYSQTSVISVIFSLVSRMASSSLRQLRRQLFRAKNFVLSVLLLLCYAEWWRPVSSCTIQAKFSVFSSTMYSCGGVMQRTVMCHVYMLIFIENVLFSYYRSE
jgi:hypothetical protein